MRFRLSAARLVMLVALLGVASATAAQSIDPGAISRVFLTDGRALPSYGEYALVGDRVVFVLAVGDAQRQVDLQLISLPVSAVNMVRTARYAEATRARRYAETRGPVEYSAITADVTVALAELEKESDPKKRLAMAEEARMRLLAWPGAHYGYRAQEIRELAGLFDDVIAELRVQAGEGRFAVALMAGPPAPEPDRPLPPLSLRDSIALALAAASVSDVVADRQAILQMAYARSADDPADDLRLEVARRLSAERTADAAYARLSEDLIARADVLMRRGDVAAVVAVRGEIADRDRALGSLRPQDVRALTERLDQMIERTQTFRLTLDHWHAVHQSLLRYERRVRPILAGVDALKGVLQNIRDMSGPDFTRLVQALTRLKSLTLQLHDVTPPPDLQSIHSTFVAAVFMAREACERRAQAVAGPNLAVARDAAAAAAGTLLLLSHARQDLVVHLFPPRFQ
jgi:hypothetical protein